MVFGGLIGHDHQLAHTFCQQALHDLQHRVAFRPLSHTLPARHGHSIVVKQLVGNVDARRNALADRQQPAVKVGAITQVGKHVRLFGERCLAHPADPFAAHLRESAGGAIHPHRHVVAANSGYGAAAFGHAGAGVVRAATAKPRRTVTRRGIGLCLLQLTGIQQCQVLVHACQHVLGHTQFFQTLGNGARNQRGGQIGVGAQQPVATGVAGLAPLAAFPVFKLAHHGGAHIITPVVQLFFDLVLNDLALFFHHQNLLQAACKVACDRGLQRPHHIHFVHPNANALAGSVIQPQVDQGLAHVVVSLAAGHDAKAVLAALHHVVVQLVGAHIGQSGVPLVVHQALLLLQRGIRPANVQATGRHGEVFGQDNVHAVWVYPDAAGGFNHLLDRLHARPQPAKTAHGKGMQAHVQNFLNAAGKENRGSTGLENVIALVGRRGAFADVVIPRQRNDTAVLRGTGHVGVLEHVRAAVNPRPFAIPDAKDTVELLRLRIQIQLLRTPQRGGGQLLIHTRLKDDVLCLQVLLGCPQRLIIGTQGRATVAADEARCIQPLLRIAQALQHGQSHQCLHTTHEGAASFQGVFVVQRDVFQR